MTVNRSEVAGIYCRLSLARMKDVHGRTIIDQTKVEDQERIGRDLCMVRHWKLAAGVGYPEPNGVFIDNNRSAWQKNRKRPGWDAMLAAVETGQLNRLAIYHGDRLVRQPWDLEMLLNLADQRGLIIASGVGDYRLDVSTDRFVLRILTASACMASDDTSRRKKQGFARMAADGRAPVPGGRFGRGFGYEADGRTPHPVESVALRVAAKRVTQGESLTVIARRLAEADVTSVSGEPLTYQSLKRVLLRPRIAGLLADGSQGNWEPIIDRQTWDIVASVLARRTPHHGGAAKYLLSGIAECGECGVPLQRQASARVLGYGCVAAGCMKIRRNMAHLDAYVSRRTWARLQRPDNPPGRAPERAGLDDEITTMEAARAETVALIADGTHRYADLLMVRLERIDERLTKLRGEKSGDAARERLVGTHLKISWEEFLSLPLTTRRSLIAALFRVEVLKVSRYGPGFNPADVRLTPI